MELDNNDFYYDDENNIKYSSPLISFDEYYDNYLNQENLNYDNQINNGTDIKDIVNTIKNEYQYNSKEINHDMENMNETHYNFLNDYKKPKNKSCGCNKKIIKQSKENFDNSSESVIINNTPPASLRESEIKEFEGKKEYYIIYGIAIGVLTIFLLNLITKISRK